MIYLFKKILKKYCKDVYPLMFQKNRDELLQDLARLQVWGRSDSSNFTKHERLIFGRLLGRSRAERQKSRIVLDRQMELCL